MVPIGSIGVEFDLLASGKARSIGYSLRDFFTPTPVSLPGNPEVTLRP